MITLINASAFRSDQGSSSSLAPQDCQRYLAQYASSKVRLWAYHCSLSRLVLRIDRPANESLRPIDLVFVGVSHIRCPVHCLLDAFEVRQAPEPPTALFGIPSADLLISASDFTIVVQDEYPPKLWELEQARIA